MNISDFYNIMIVSSNIIQSIKFCTVTIGLLFIKAEGFLIQDCVIKIALVKGFFIQSRP